MSPINTGSEYGLKIPSAPDSNQLYLPGSDCGESAMQQSGKQVTSDNILTDSGSVQFEVDVQDNNQREGGEG